MGTFKTIFASCRGHVQQFTRFRSNSSLVCEDRYPEYRTLVRKFCVNVGETIQERGSGVKEVKSLLENSASYQDVHHPDIWSSSVYPVLPPREISGRPKVDPATTSIILFPGQGSQHVGMSKDLLDYPNVQEMFGAASEILKYDLLDLCLHGPQDRLDMTAHCQVAIMVSSLAALEKLKTDSPLAIENCVAAAGFSVGEYTALVFAGALTFEDAVALLKIRGESMQKASELVRSGMMTVFLEPAAKIKSACVSAKEWCSQQNISSPECQVATYLSPNCKVISGNLEALNRCPSLKISLTVWVFLAQLQNRWTLDVATEKWFATAGAILMALEFLEKNASEYSIRRVKYIPVSGAFHSKLMDPAKDILASALNCVDFQTPLIQVYSNVDSNYYTSPENIKKKLAKQLCSPVKWQQIMIKLFNRPEGTPFPEVYECGPGTTLRTTLKMINPKASVNYKNIKA